ncbi:Tyrosine-protein phosphatase non-receptor type 13 [Dirofilaria immitis]|nr:Tyrosine-protein phosphatase non-receptor type 13 [Dirofilaria immitis]
MSLDNGSVARGPHYRSYDFTTFGHCKTKADTTTDLGDECTDFYNIKKPTSASSVTLKQTSTPSPSYPSANSWPGFGNRYAHSGEDIQVPTVDSIKSPSAAKCELPFRQQKTRRRVYVFSSKMANDAAIGVRQKSTNRLLLGMKQIADRVLPSAISWMIARRLPYRRKNGVVLTPKFQQDYRNGSPMRSCGTPSVCSPSSTMLPTPSQTSGESNGNPPSNPSDTPSGELLNPDDRTDIVDNPLRRMERMTQDSLFESQSKLCRTSTDNTQPARREQDRNAKLEKMRTLEQQIIYDKAKSEWDRMMHEHEAIKMTRGHMPPLMPPCSQASAPAPYPCTFANQNGVLMQGSCGRPIYPQPLQPTEPPSSMSNVPMNTSLMMSLPQTSGPNMPMSQPLRPSLNPSACSMQYSQCGFMCCPFPLTHVLPTRISSYKCYGIYQQGVHTICSPEKIECEIWNRQMPAEALTRDGMYLSRLPSNVFIGKDSFQDTEIIVHKSRISTNGAVMDGKLLDAVASANSMESESTDSLPKKWKAERRQLSADRQNRETLLFHSETETPKNRTQSGAAIDLVFLARNLMGDIGVSLSEIIEVRGCGLNDDELLALIIIGCEVLIKTPAGVFSPEHVILYTDGELEIKSVPRDRVSNEYVPPEMQEGNTDVDPGAVHVYCLGEVIRFAGAAESGNADLFSLLNVMTVAHIATRPSVIRLGQMAKNKLTIQNPKALLAEMYILVMGDEAEDIDDLDISSGEYVPNSLGESGDLKNLEWKHEEAGTIKNGTYNRLRKMTQADPCNGEKTAIFGGCQEEKIRLAR